MVCMVRNKDVAVGMSTPAAIPLILSKGYLYGVRISARAHTQGYVQQAS
jgi:hypothetical protein